MIRALFATILFAITSMSWAHPGDSPMFMVDYNLFDDALQVNVVITQEGIKPLIKHDTVLNATPDEATRNALLTASHQLIKLGSQVKIDGILVQPAPKEATFLILADVKPIGDDTATIKIRPAAVGGLHFQMRYPLKSKPKQISIAWTKPELWTILEDRHQMENLGNDEAMAEPVFLYSALRIGRKRIDMLLSADEPEYIWHAPKAVPQSAIAKAKDANSPKVPEWHLHAMRAGMMLFGAILFWFMVNREGKIAKRVVPYVTAAIAATALLNAYRAWDATKPLSSRPANAVETFRSLHTNIYRAFDYNTDEEVYDTLAQSVSGDALERLFLDINQSLVLEDEGGAVCNIQRISMKDTEFVTVPAPTAERYQVRATWEVTGTVSHWGHTHTRVNMYEATYTVALVNDAWKIVATDVHDHKVKDTSSEKKKASPAPATPTSPAGSDA